MPDLESSYRSKVLTATVTEQECVINVRKILLIANDSTENDLYISLDDNFNENNFIVIKPESGRTYSADSISCRKFKYKTLEGTAVLRFEGIKA
jgi:hypothetical protein